MLRLVLRSLTAPEGLKGLGERSQGEALAAPEMSELQQRQH